MMRIINHGINNLAAEMLNMEHGYRKYNADLSLRDPPYELNILIDVPPVTKNGRTVKINYKPVVGVVYFIPDCNVSKLIADIKRILNNYPSDHLNSLKSKISPAYFAIAKSKYNGKLGESRCITYIKKFTKNLPFDTDFGFSWLFISVEKIISHQNFDINHANNILAGLIFDPNNYITLERDKKIEKITLSDFTFHRKTTAVEMGCFIVDADLNLSFSLQIPQPSNHAVLPKLEWERISTVPLDYYSCAHCDVPLGDIVVVVIPNYTYGIIHPLFSYMMKENHKEHFLLCDTCRAMKKPVCACESLDASMFQTTLPISRSKSFAVNENHKHLAPLFEDKIKWIEGYEGDIMITKSAIITSFNIGEFPLISHPILREMTLPIITMANIAWFSFVPNKSKKNKSRIL